MKCYNIPESIIKTWRNNKNIKEFIDLLKDTDNEKSDLKNAEELLEGFPSSGISTDEAEIIKGQLRDFIKEEKIKNPLKSNPFSYLPDDFKLSIWVGNNHTDKIKYWFKEKFLMNTLFGRSNSYRYVSESMFNFEVGKLKNSIFSTISKYLGEPDIDITKRDNYEEYTKRIGDFLKSFERKTIQNLPSIEDYPSNIEEIYAFTTIVNFDKLLENIFGDIFVVKDKNYFNSLDAEYVYSKEKITSEYFTRDDEDSQNALGIASKFTKHIVDIIPYTPIKQTSTTKLTHLNIANLKTLGAVIFDSLQENMKFFKDNLIISFSGKDAFSVDTDKILEFRKKYNLKSTDRSITFEDLDFENNASNSIWVVLEYINSVSTNEERLQDYYKLRDFISVPNINVVNSIMDFLNSNNIQEKDNRSGHLKLMDLFITEMENSALATYVSIEDRKVVRRNLGKYNNAAIYLQDNANSTLKRRKGSYTKSPDPLFKIPENIKNLLKTNVATISNSQDQINLHKFFNKNLKRWLGTSMNMEAFEVFINDVNKPTESIIEDIEDFIKTALSSEPVEVETGRELIAPHLAKPIWKAIENSIVSRNNSLPVTTVRTEEGKKIPTFKIPTHIYADLALLQKGESGNIFVDNVGSLVGTEQKLEVVSKGKSLDASKLKEKDDYLFEDVHLFFKSVLNGRFSFSVTTYSDKKSQFLKVASIDPFIDVTAETYVNKVKNLNIQRLQNIVDKFKFIFKDSVLGGDLNTELQIIEDRLNTVNNFVLGEDLNTNLQIIEDRLNAINNYSEFELYLKNAIKKDKDFELTEEVHYSNINGKMIIPRYIWWSTLLDPEIYKKTIENRHIEKYLKYISNGKNEIKFLGEKEIDDLLDFFKISKEDYKKMFVENGFINKHKVYYEENGERILNPLLAKNLWIKNLARHDYMELSAKNEFIDPIKYNSDKLKYSLENYLDVAEKKFVAGSKRANLYTASIEKGVAHVRNNDLKMVIVEELKSHIINPENSGKWSPLDGGSLIDAREYYSTLEAYPGKDYAGVFKRFGTFVSKDKSAQKKDSEKFISNDFIRLSGFGYNPLKTLWGHDVIPENEKKSYVLGASYFIGDKKITNIKIQYENNTWVALLNGDPKEFNTLYDLWEILGGAETTNEAGQYTEDSQKLIHKISSFFDWWNIGSHIWTTNTTVKRGITNLNSRTSILKGEAPMHMKVNRFSLGMQLDANKEIGDSEIREVSQVISALSQNHFSNEIATSIYASMNKSITKAIKSFFGENLTDTIISIVERNISSSKSPAILSKNVINELEDLFEQKLNKDLISIINKSVKNNFLTNTKTLGKNIADEVKNYSGENLTDPELINTIRNTVKKQMLSSMERTSIEDLGTSIARVVGDRFPISSQTFFKSFVKQMLVIMNDEFNISKYSGMGVILVATEGFVKVAETTNARGEKIIKTYSDLMKEVTNAKKVANSDFLTTYKKENTQHTSILTALIEALNKKNVNLDKNYGEKIVSLLLAGNLIKIQC